MKNIFSLLFVLSLIAGCKSTTGKTSNTQTTSEYGSQEDEMKYYFTATGNEPFWGLKMGNEEIIFTSLIPGKEKLVFAPVEAIKAMDTNVKMYKAANETSITTITIQQVDCQNSMSGAISPYKVSIEIKNNTELETKKIGGCGKYNTDYRLHDIWVLEELNGFKVFTTDFQRELPRIEINSSENRFMGYGGCNAISGTIFYEKDLLRFSKVISTLMACAPGNKEGEFTKALQSTTTYSIENNRLTLSNPSAKLLVFRKVD
ncbi:Heat shock protein HslJ [Flavobacterium sp. CF108]|uniref:META domain-containing protein n=1 Tax=unclassified Flavobacterium TaxID=196869 RepID=UPI0008C306CA|nr:MULTISPECIES: META domain-containing protein [unclassified Flavobacterium]SEN97726.1 Heat shock protein HslJ [Flavobacterium sp. fv08]SHH32368.1 Heat shock protein HslJ [Flavobacterium sp. CF108]